MFDRKLFSEFDVYWQKYSELKDERSYGADEMELDKLLKYN